MRQINTLPRGQMEAMFNADTMRMMFAGLPAAHVDEYVEVLGSPEAMRGVLDWYRAGSLPREASVARGMDPDFPAIEVPTLYVWSDQDIAIGPEGAYATEQYVRGPYRFVVLEGIGHWIPETAAEKFNAELLAHLARHPRHC
jgi:pimeloyl-ACP methyl ester carboxylesterase